MKIFTCCFLLAFLSQAAYAQDSCAILGKFKGKINGTIYLYPAIEQKVYYGEVFHASDSSTIDNGKFAFKIKLRDKGVYPFRFLVRSEENESLTGEVYLQPGKILVSIDSMDEYIAPTVVRSAVQMEYSDFYLSMFRKHIHRSLFLDSLYTAELETKGNLSSAEKYLWRKRDDSMSVAGDEILRRYIEFHPFSPVASWKLIQRFEANGYRSIYEDCFLKLGEKFRQSVNGLELSRRLTSAGRLSEGRVFPKMSALDMSGREFIIDSAFFRTNKFTLVDFWFHNCGPCIRQFNEMRDIYDDLKLEGLEVLAISVDKREELGLWKSKVNELRVIWSNVIDVGGQESQHYLVNSFPTGFLVNSEGKIVKKNIDIYELKLFLNQLKGK